MQERENLRHMIHEMRAHMERLQAEIKDGNTAETRKELKEEEFKHSVASGAWINTIMYPVFLLRKQACLSEYLQNMWPILKKN